MVVGLCMESLVEFAPVQTLHFVIDIIKLAIHPIYYGVKVSFYLVNIFITTMRSHIAVHVSFTYPFQSSC